MISTIVTAIVAAIVTIVITPLRRFRARSRHPGHITLQFPRRLPSNQGRITSSSDHRCHRLEQRVFQVGARCPTGLPRNQSLQLAPHLTTPLDPHRDVFINASILRSKDRVGSHAMGRLFLSSLNYASWTGSRRRGSTGPQKHFEMKCFKMSRRMSGEDLISPGSHCDTIPPRYQRGTHRDTHRETRETYGYPGKPPGYPGIPLGYGYTRDVHGRDIPGY
jgi:hypothetical protein